MNMGKKTKVLKNIMWVIRSIMEYDEKYLFIVGIVTMIGGILPPLCTIISQKIMNGLQERRDLHTLLFLVEHNFQMKGAQKNTVMFK